MKRRHSVLQAAMVAGLGLFAVPNCNAYIIDANSVSIRLLSGGAVTYTASAATVDLFGLVSSQLSFSPPASGTLSYDPDVGSLTGVQVRSPMDRQTVENNTLLTMRSFGGLSITLQRNAANASYTNGGRLTFSNLEIDFAKHIVYGDVAGANACAQPLAGTAPSPSYCGTGTNSTPAFSINSRVPLFTFRPQNVTGPVDELTTPPPPYSFFVHPFSAKIAGLRLIGNSAGSFAANGAAIPWVSTASGSALDIFERSLALKGLGLSTLRNDLDFGSLTMEWAYSDLSYGSPYSLGHLSFPTVVPELDSSIAMLLGLGSLFAARTLVKRRRDH